ncbi:MAG TPA: hypothetical protein PKE25_01665 [Novosphingobium sp.]|nr:hypothetical protein [Novosphingobium sp.]
MTVRLLVPALCLLLTACGKESQAPVAAQAGGEVLEGSISDAMLPLDTVRSQAPLAPRPTEGAAAKAATSEKSDQAEAEAEAAPVRPDAE